MYRHWYGVCLGVYKAQCFLFRFSILPAFFNSSLPTPSIKMALQHPKIVFGTGSLPSLSDDVLKSMLNTLEKYDVKELDAAYILVCIPPFGEI